MPASPPETRAKPDSEAAERRRCGRLGTSSSELYGPVIYRSARGRGLQTADAENLVQEVLIKVTQSVTKWLDRSDRGSFRAWLLTIARNEAVNMLSLRATRALGKDGDEGMKKLSERPDFGEISRFDRHGIQTRRYFGWAAGSRQKCCGPRHLAGLLDDTCGGSHHRRSGREIGHANPATFTWDEVA